MARIMPRGGDVVRLANPATTKRQATENTAPTIVLLVGALIAIQAVKAGGWPGAGDLVKDGVLVGAFLLAATVAPELVVWILLVALLWVVLTNTPLVEQLIARMTRAIPVRRAA